MSVRGKGAMAAAVAMAAVTVPGVGIDIDLGGKDNGRQAVGLGTDGKTLIGFRTDRGHKAKVLGTVRGLSGDTRLVGIDYRVQDGRLYGVGDAGGVYTVAGTTATPVSRLSTALSGTAFGVDFNPAANRLRIISDTGQSLRHNIDDGATAGTTVTDGSLTYPPATAVRPVSAAPATPTTTSTRARRRRCSTSMSPSTRWRSSPRRTPERSRSPANWGPMRPEPGSTSSAN